METKSFPKPVLIGIVAVAVVVVIGAIVFTRRSNSLPQTTGPIPTSASDETPIPTVDSSVIVDLQQKTPGKEVVLVISHVPNGTKTIEYSLTYDTRKQNAQGVIGTISTSAETKEYQKQITLGTCSSGTCVYHDVVGPIKVSLKFTGSFGEKVFEKDFSF